MEFWNKLSEALKQKGFSTAQIKKLQEAFGHLDAAGLLSLTEDQLLPFMTGRTVAEKREKIETLLAVAREVQAQLEGGPPSPTRGSFTITGQIHTTDGQTLANVTVRAYERGVGRQTLLGEATTDTDGKYRITILPEKFITLERKRPHLVVRAYTERKKLLGTSEITFNATSGQAVDLNVVSFKEAPLSTYETLAAKLSLLLGGQQLADLSDDDTKILGVEAGVDLKQVEWLRKGARLARATRLPAETLYALASQRLPLELEKLLAQSDEKIQAALEAALKQNVIPAMPDGFTDSVLARFEELRVKQGLLLQHEITGQLQNQETDKPLAGFTVRIVDLNAQPRDRESGMTSTDQAGEFSIAYTARPRSQARRSFRLHILDRQGKELQTTEVKARPGQAKLDDPISVKLPPIDRPSPRVIELASTLRLNLSQELSAALERHKIATLDDIRRIGGLERLKDAAVGFDDPAVKRLQAHADLRALSDDIKVNDALIDKGYDSIHAVSRKTRRDFTKDMLVSLGEEQAVRLNDVARKQALLLDNLATKYRVDQANGFSSTSTATDDELGLETPCRCRECESAVSPLAYLTDLLDYAVRHVKNYDNSISLAFLEESFHQPFGELPVSCTSGEEQMRQVRLAVEVLRSILDGTNIEPHMVQQLMSTHRVYRMAAYQFLLLRIGTSYDELRLTRRGSLEEKKALAERLAITQVGDVSPHQLINQLWLDPEKQYPDLQALNEVNLERLFGLPATDVQSRFSKGARLGDEQDQISDWQLDGLAWLRNTDENGRVHLSLTKSVNTVLIKLYRNQARHETSLVASGSRTGNNGTVSLVEENLSGLSGTLTLQYKPTTTNISFVVFPFLLSWRLAHLRQQWLASKKPQHDSLFGALPVIDPDLVGPDDLRHPEPGNPAFDIWLARRNWVDDLLKELRSQTKTAADGQTAPDVQKMMDVMEDTGWQATTIADLEALDDLIQQATNLDAATNQLGRLFLSKASFRRMMDIKAKAERWEGDAGDPVTSDEWEEFYSILVQSLKQAMGSAWRTQEQGISGTLRSLEFFWPAPREPVEGQWPPLRPRGQPLIDPDTVKETDLPDLAAGDQARQYLEDRRAEVMAVNEQLQATREAHGLEALLVQGLGAAPARTSWDDELNRLQEDRLSSNAATADAARDRIASDLRMSETEFGLLMTVKSKAGQTDSAQAPKPDEWASIYKLLTRVEKERVRFPQWIAAEIGLAYWNFRKARLPRWRATMEARQGWLEELQSTANLPVIDPDLLDIPDFITPFSEDKAFGLWQERASELSTLKQELTNVTGTNHLAKIDKLLTTYLGIEADRLEALTKAANEGNLTTARLQQLTVSRAELDFLLRVRALASEDSASSAVIDEEWDDLYNILIQVEKRRKLFPKWRLAERNLGLVLSPDHFKLRQPQFLATPSPPPGPLNTWRAKASDRRDWDKTLKARIQQQDSITQALSSAVSATEEATLADLRNDLIGVLNESDKALAIAAKEMSQRLLIDMNNSGCQMTTRASQAILSIQQLLWSLRDNSLKSAWPDLSLDAENFDEEWKWLGSYATWRAAMMVFLYPENILLPNLRKGERSTPAFQELIKTLQTSTDFTGAVNGYLNYFRDVTQLSLEATCEADAVIQNYGSTEKSESWFLIKHKFMFARSKASGKIYWSSYEPYGGAGKGYEQTLWRCVPDLDNLDIVNLLGVVPYRTPAGERFLCLFLLAEENGKNKLFLKRYNRRQHWSIAWEQASKELELPENVGSQVIVKQQANEMRKPHIAAYQHGVGFIHRILNAEGTDWDSSWGWRILLYYSRFSNPGLIKLLAMIDTTDPSTTSNQDNTYNTFFLFWRDGFQINLLPFRDWYDAQRDISPVILPVLISDNHLTWPGWQGAFYSQSIKRIFAFYLRDPNPISATETRETQYRSIGILGDFFDQNYLFQDIPDYQLGGIVEDPNNPYKNWSPVKSFKYAASYFPVHSNKQTDPGAARDLFYVNAFRPQNALEMTTLFLSRIDMGMQQDGYPLSEMIVPRKLAPLVPSSKADTYPWIFRVGEDFSPQTQTLRSKLTETMYSVLNAAGELYPTQSSSNRGRTNRIYIEEAYYHMPIFAGRELHLNGQYEKALVWFRSVYDFTLPWNQRKVYYGLKVDETLDVQWNRDEFAFSDAFAPHELAETRSQSHTRFVLISTIRCMLDYADSLFTQDTVETNAKARQLYHKALELLDAPELKQAGEMCDELIGKLILKIKNFGQIDIPTAMLGLRLLNKTVLKEKTGQINSTLSSGASDEIKAKDIRRVLSEIRQITAQSKTLARGLEESRLFILGAHRMLISSDIIYRLPSTTVLNQSWLPGVFTFCIPPNPVPTALRYHAQLNLYKLYTCRNIAGMERELKSNTAATDVMRDLPVIGSSGQITLPTTFNILPTLYRYQILTERAKQLVGIAQQIETTFFNLLEKGDMERYNLLNAYHGADLARQGVTLQNLRVGEAERNVILYKVQTTLIRMKSDHYAGLIEQSLIGYEQQAISSLHSAIQAYSTAATASAALGWLNIFSVNAGLNLGVSISPGGLANWISNSASLVASIASTESNLLSMHASFIRREEEWKFQQALADHEIRVNDQHLQNAQDRVRIAGQEREIALMQVDHADDVIEFLSTKFTNADLYDWMSGVMEGVYRYFLQQSTGIARLAENQLAFERQEMPPAFIQADYWDAPRDGSIITNDNGNVTDRRGLTGSARLLQDIYRLDQYAFETDKRKLQLTKTISLARLDPVVFQQFRETGVMVFATPMTLFDHDFPGHYLRLIKRVRTSVIALISPIEGVKATLTTAGISRVVIGGDWFQTTIVNRGPESVALTSPQNATGLFELESQGQGEMLLPFEGLGVDTTWEFRLPKPANAFDYRTIADVLITIEYTALDSPTYRHQVIHQLDNTVSADRPFSFRHQFADAWYDLHHPDLVQEPQKPMEVRFTTRHEDFPPNITELEIEQVTLYFARKDGVDEEIEIDDFRFIQQGTVGAVGGAATTVNGIISTRQGNAGAWTSLIGKSPVGEWTLALKDKPETRQLFAEDKIEDILFVITFGGKTPEWPK